MAYTRPAPTAADLEFGAAYTRPASTAADFSFLSGYVTSGFTATLFGTPLTVTGHFGDVTGFTETLFGTPLATYPQTLEATGFDTTTYGTPIAGYNRTEVASGSNNTLFGDPSISTTVVGVGAIPDTMFGTPVAAYPQWLDAEGFTTAAIGHAVAFRYGPVDLDRTVLASQVPRSTVFGQPVASPTVSCEATGSLFGAFGTPAGSTSDRCAASSLEPATTFGVATVNVLVGASGFRNTLLGTPNHDRGQLVSGIAPRTSFGEPGYLRGNASQPTGWLCAVRFGHPHAFSRFNYPAAGFESTAQFGAPTCVQRHRVTAIPPGTRFGTPLLQRNPTC